MRRCGLIRDDSAEIGLAKISMSHCLQAKHVIALSYIRHSGYMDGPIAITALAALAQPTRLETFRLLVSHEPDGVAAGELARLLAVPQNTMSAHLAVLARAGLVAGERSSRTITYHACPSQIRALVLFMLRDCCGARAELCAPLIANLSQSDAATCCQPNLSRKEAVHG
jgi:ArsR family transcriptional regulator, arsenate/arsenite/antimonite-responsive transcriptional repressor